MNFSFRNRDSRSGLRGRVSGFLLLSLIAAPVFGADVETDQRLKLLEQQNQTLQQKLLQQQTLIDDLAKKLNQFDGKSDSRASEEPQKKGASLGQVRISGEGGVGIFHTSSQGTYNNSPFRVDEAKLFLEAPLWKNLAFAFIEMDLMTRERQVTPAADENFHLGEAYVDFEGVSRLWGHPGMLGIRVGRIDIPFGEEYIARDVIDNPLISHSLSDIWGVDEGIAFYGGIGKFDYVFAVQNGGHPQLADFHRDKSVTARVGWTPAKWLRVSGSAMRTGALDAANDKMSEFWFGNGFFRAIGAGATLYEADVFEGDVQFFWKNGHFKTAGGWIDFSDNAPTGNGERDVYYYYAEAMQRLPQLTKLYGAARVSQLFADGGFPVVGHGNFGPMFFTPGMMTDRMLRLSAGAGYTFSDHLTLKVEYTLDRRHVISLANAYDVHFVGAEIGFSF